MFIGVAAAFLVMTAAQAEPANSLRARPRQTATTPLCERRAIADTVAHFTFLVDSGRYGATVPLWLPRRRLPTPAFFAILGRNIRAARGADVPAAVRRWAGPTSGTSS